MNECFSESYQTKRKIYDEMMFPAIMGKMIATGVAPVTMVRLRFETRRQRERFLNGSQLLLDEKVTCFGGEEENLVLLFSQYQCMEARHVWETMKKYDGSVVAAGHCPQGGDALWSTYRLFKEQTASALSGRGYAVDGRLP